MRRGVFFDAAVLCCLTAALIWPLFRLEYMDNWSSIESTFISDARVLKAGLPHPGWQPLWYCGTRFDYVYPPALRYGTAVLSKLGGVSTARSYHLYTALFYVFGIVSVYALAIAGTGARAPAFLSALATALLSPSFLFLPLIRADSGFRIPQRLHVLAQYGEGPHISALCVIPAALAAAFLFLRKGRPGALAASGALCALVVANNFYGATALATLFPVMVWAVWSGERTWKVWWRAVLIAAVAYGLSAFWLTPSFVHITLVDMQWVSQPGKTWSVITEAIVIVVFCAVTWRIGKPQREWSIFVIGAALILSLNVLGFYYWGFRISGESARLVPELDLALILASVELLRVIWRQPHGRIPAVLLVALAFYPAVRYLQHVWSAFPKAPSLNTQYEYRTARWVADHVPGERVLPSGTVRFWYDAWFDNAQLDGGSMQGMLNQIIPVATNQILHGDQADLAILWLQALGTGAVIVPDKTSPEPYQDYQFPHKFKGSAPVLFDDSHGTVIYSIPRVHPGIGRIVNSKEIEGSAPVRGGDDREGLRRYLAVVENSGQPFTKVTWHGSDEVQVDSEAVPGQAVLLQETYDPAWHAYEKGRELLVRADPVMNFMLIDVPAGSHTIKMRFEVPLENRAGQLLFGITLFAGLLMIRRRSSFG